MASANSSGGVMGKMIDAQSIVLAVLVGGLVTLQASVPLFTSLVSEATIHSGTPAH